MRLAVCLLPMLALLVLQQTVEAHSPLHVLHVTGAMKSQHTVTQHISRLESGASPLTPETLLRRSEMDGVEKVEEDFFCIGCVWDHMCRKR